MSFWKKFGNIASAIIDEAPGVMASLQKAGAKKQAELYKNGERQLNEYERKISNAQKSDKMNDPAYSRRVNEAKEKLENAKINLYTGTSSSNSIKANSSGQITISGKTVAQWDREWRYLGILGSMGLDDLRPYNQSIGLYKAEMNGKIYYIGRAIEQYNGGFRKRLRDYVRTSDSARTHKSGNYMNDNADKLSVSILILSTVEDVKALEVAMIRRYAPNWNVQSNR
jgi:hypothetical protein